jgi:hypothetical protein
VVRHQGKGDENLLKRAGTTPFVLLFAAFANIVVAEQASAEPVECPAGSVWNPQAVTCVLKVTPPASGITHRSTKRESGSHPVNSKSPKRCVSSFSGKEVPCRDGSSWWSNARDCYVSLADPQPAKSDPEWEGHKTGAIYECYSPALVGSRMFTFWSATAPTGPAAPPEPRALALRAIATMRLRAIGIGIVPEPQPGSVGIVGMPTWMWVANPGQHTWGPITRTASSVGYRVTATAKVQRVVWAMGDGRTVICTKRGTPYADSFGKRASPDCGHIYTRQGTYTVRATSYWRVTWAGSGQNGTIPLDFTRTAVITMGEAQVLIR